MSFADMFKNEAIKTYTENGGRCFNTTDGGDLLDLFANIGGMRNREDIDIIQTWKAARRENEELADNLVLYARNVRDGGLGERRIGRLLLKELAKFNSEKIKKNFQKIVDTGRWDDLFVFEGTSVETEMWQFVETQFRTDVKNMRENKPITLLAKWMPSINTSSDETRKLANKFCKKFSVTPRTYRKTLSTMRKYIDVVEKKMSAGQWNEINFEGVPSVAMSRYISTFNKRVPERFQKYKDALVKGEAKVNAATLYPYDIVKPLCSKSVRELDTIAEEQWKALPNYVGESDNILVVADTSGSMEYDGYRPISTAVGLAIYFAQRNHGEYHNIFCNFSSSPSFHKISDNWSLTQCVRQVMSANWGWSTNLDAVFAKVYEVARMSHDAPKAIVIISDMEVNSWAGQDYCESIAEKWKKKFEYIGVPMSKIIYWNVESRSNNTLSRCSENVGYVSGQSTGTFKFMQTLINKSAFEAMEEILTKPEFTWA